MPNSSSKTVLSLAESAIHPTSIGVAGMLVIGMLVRVPFVIATLRMPGFNWHWGGELFSVAHAIVSAATSRAARPTSDERFMMTRRGGDEFFCSPCANGRPMGGHSSGLASSNVARSRFRCVAQPRFDHRSRTAATGVGRARGVCVPSPS